jgi:hypothetical protein
MKRTKKTRAKFASKKGRSLSAGVHSHLSNARVRRAYVHEVKVDLRMPGASLFKPTQAFLK